MKKIKVRKPIGHTIWFKVILTLLIFIPPIAQKAYDPAKSTDVITAVMSHPLILSIFIFLPIAKLLLMCVVIITFFHRASNAVLIGYYTFILLAVGIFQNISNTDNYGYVWLIGNTLAQLAVLFYCLYDVSHQKSVIMKKNINRKRLWVLIPMLFAFLMPYSVNIQGIIQPSLTSSVLWNEAGVTYCMITPVVIGMMLIFSKGIYKPLLSVVSYVGFMFGLLNMMTWFIMQSQNWWMGILHLPLLILSFYGLIIARYKIQ